MSSEPVREGLLTALRQAAEGKPQTLPAELQRSSFEMKRIKEARAIEAQAGIGLKRPYWLEQKWTPFGIFSRRSIAVTVIGSILWVSMLFFAIQWRINYSPAMAAVPETDAFSVMNHVYAHFPVQKDASFFAFTPPAQDQWRFRDAYSFRWNSNGQQAQVVIASYDNQTALSEDYRDRTRPVSPTDYNAAMFGGGDLIAETRNRDVYGSEWKAWRLGNMLLLVSANANPLDAQQLTSHFVSFVGAGHRDFIPTATPMN